MNKRQYNNIIKNTLKRVHTEDSLSAARAVFKNMGVALPGGDMKEVFETVKTDNYMGWKSCTMEEAQAAANKGTAAIGISDNKIVVLAADDAEEPIEPTAEVLAITDSTPAVAVANLQYYSYGSVSTGQGCGGGSSTTCCRKAIIIIPGIMGSELFAGEQIGDFNCGTKLWDPSVNLQADDKIRKLICNSSGESMYNIYAGNENFGAKKTYKRLYQRLSNIFSSSYDIIYFPYDWRMSCADAAQKLNTYINCSNYDKVVLVAHSMGGLVAANYLAIGTQQRLKVEKLIALGSPFLGATELIRVYTNGMDLGFPGGLVANDDIKNIMPNIKSVYELLPTQKWFELTNKKVFTYTKLYTVPGYEDDGQTFVSQTYNDTKNRLYKKLRNSNSMLLLLAENMHSNLFINGNYVTNLVDSYYIVGTNLPTVNSITATVTGETGAIETMGYPETNNGDGTVATWSANIGSLYPSRTYYASGREHCGEYDFNKNTIKTEGLVVSENVIQLIRNIINNSSALPSGISRNE